MGQIYAHEPTPNFAKYRVYQTIKCTVAIAPAIGFAKARQRQRQQCETTD
jgi:hypothetical protein